MDSDCDSLLLERTAVPPILAYPVKRRYPRIPFEQSAQIDFLDRAQGTRVTQTVAVKTIACEGMSLATTEPEPLELARRARVNIAFAIGGETLSLPGTVAWARDGTLGVHLLLELARPETRQRWAHWIVEKTSKHRSDVRRARTSKKFLRN